jgi:hypothetical protein
MIECHVDRRRLSYVEERPAPGRGTIHVRATWSGPLLVVSEGALEISLWLTSELANQLGEDLIANAAQYTKALGDS